MKKCRGCELHFPLNDYYVRSASPNGVTTRCKKCINEDRILKRYLRNKKQKSILFDRQTFATMYPSVNKTSFKSWVYRNTEIESLKGIFGSELDELVDRYENRVDGRVKESKKCI